MLPIAGTVRNSVKMAVLDSKWQQKKDSGNIFQKDMTPQERQLAMFKEDMQKMRESDAMSSISSKMKSGAQLTPEEIEYLQKNAPEMYQEYVKIKQEQEAYERQLKNCRTQEDVDRLKMNKMGSLLAEAKTITNNPNIPKGKKKELMEKLLMRTMGVQKIHMAFIESGRYASLPTEEEVKEEAKDKAERSEATAKELGEQVEEIDGQKGATENFDNQESVTEAIAQNQEKEFDFPEEKRKKKRPENSVMKEESADYVSETKADFCSAEISFADVRTQIVNLMKANGFTGLGHEYKV